MQNKNLGFTLIELLIVISIIGMLATMAVPSFMDRTIRAQVKEALALSEIAKKGVEDHYRVKGKLPKDNVKAGLPKPEKIIGNYVTSVQVIDGAINIKLGNRINRFASGKTITLRPAIVDDAPRVPIAWVCGYASIPNGMTMPAKNNSDILKRHVPVNCRY